MAITEKQAIMVIHQEGMTTSAPQASSARSLFVVLKPLHPGGGGQDEGALLATKEASPLRTSAVGFQKLTSMSLSAMAGANSSNQLWNLPAESTCKGITVTLDNNNMWNEFYRCQTEMILTKQGRRMFPCCRFRISGLEPFQRYTLVMDMHPVDNHRYKWSDRRWETNGKGDPHILSSFVHPESPATGLDWMQNPVSFYKLKLTNNPSDQEGHIVINSMHRYLPRLHIIPADKATDVVQLNGPDVVTFSFPQTEFFAVTAYQNLCITQLKIDYNPFAKGFRDDATNSRSCKPKTGLSTETVDSEVKPSRETTTLNNLKTLFAKRSAAEKVLKVQSLPAPNDENLKAVNGDAPVNAELEKTSSKKRPWPEGLSELIKGAHVKVKRISLEKLHDGSDQQMASSSCTLPAGKQKKDAASKDCKMENVSVTAINKEEMETEKKPKKGSGTVDVRNIVDAEGPKSANTVSISIATNSSTIKNTNMQMNSSGIVISDTSINERVDTALSETATKTDGRDTSQSLVKPPDCRGEVKKKRAEPVPLPLLALFLQQLKSKTRPTRPKSKCETSGSPSHTDKSCKISVAENVPPTTESFSPSLTTQSNAQPVASVISETVTSSILTCTVSNAIVSPCLSLLPATSSSTSLITSPTLPDMPSPLKPSPPLVDPAQNPDPVLAEHKAASTLDSDTSIVTTPTAVAVSETMLVSKQQDAPVTLSAFSDNTVPNSFLSVTTPDNNVVSNADAPSAISSSSRPKTFPVTISDSPKDELVYSNVVTAETDLDSCTDPCAEFVPEAPYQSPLSDDDDIPFSPSSPPSTEFSLPSPAPSSPDPFPPGLFSDRPIPPRKSLDPFPSGLLFDRPRPLVDSFDSLPRSIFFTKPSRTGESEPTTESVSSEVTCSLAPDPCIPTETDQSLQESTTRKTKVKPKKGGKLKLSEDAEVTEGPVPVPLQPNLEDVEGQLFVSFMSKKALEIHLGDEAKEETSQKSTENINDEDPQNTQERIDALEKDLLRDLKIMKHRQVIHPVLQAVGLKLNLLDLTLAIDLQYLGVCLPIPPPVVLPGESSGSSTSSQVQFVSRTGKTTDFTKIKGWRDKFTTSSSSTLPGGTSSDAGQKNLSAFCSDMLDEYLESEGKLIDERAASFSQAAVTPVAYQLPTKSTSYVRTLDSVLKKQAPPSTTASLKPSLASRKFTLSSKSKEIAKLGENGSKKSKYVAAKTASSTDKPSSTSSKEGPKVEENSSKKFAKSGASKPVYSEPSAPCSVCPSKTSAKIKTRKGSKTSQASSLPDGKPVVNSMSMATVGQDSTSSTPGGRITGLSKTLVKLLDLEDSAVWEGKRRTCITEERAAIALSSLVTAESPVKSSPSTIIRRRAPPCLNDFCRLGCVCTSLAQERRQHHCGKPQCMLGCDCLRRKVVLLKHSKDEDSKKDLIAQGQPDEDETEMLKKKKRRKAYILSGPESAPEPATRVKRLWDQKNEADTECLFIPTPARPLRPPLLSPELQQDLENFLHPLPNKVLNDGGLKLTKGGKQSCARVRPFCRTNQCHTGQQSKKQGDPHLGPEDSLEDMEEGELRPPVLSGPTKRLEIVSKCKWATAGSRNVVLRVVCEHMAQDRLNHPFWVGKYHIQPISTTVQETDEGSTITYKVSISQPKPVKNDQKKEENEKIKQLEAQLIKTIGKSEVKGLPLLSQVTPAGLLKAEKKPPGASGQITVNGKPYPQAKLELGQMGALHPANRLAAYITGRVCLDNQNATKAVTTATISTTTPTTSTTITRAVATTASVTGTRSSAVISVKPIVTKPPVGTVFTQVVINHMNSQQQKLPSTSAPQCLSSIKNLINPPSSLMTGVTGVSVVSNTPSKASMASWAPAASGPTDGPVQVVKAVPVSGSIAPVKKTFVFSSTGLRASAPGGGVRLMQPVTSAQPPVPGQRMVFQMLKTANGGTVYRNPSGQLVQLVPLSQFRALNPNFLIPKQIFSRIVHFTSHHCEFMYIYPPLFVFPHLLQSKPQNASSVSPVISSIPPTSTAPLLQAQNLTPVHSTATFSMTTTVTSSVTVKPAVSFSDLKSTLSQPGTVNIVPGILSNTAKDILKIVTPGVIKDSKHASITENSSASTRQSTLNAAPAKGGIVLITAPSSLSSQNQDLKKSDSNIKVSCVPTEGSEQDVQSSSCSKKPSDSVVLEDHCYTFETKGTSTSCEKPEDPTDASNPANASASNTLPKELLEFGPVEEDEESDVEDEALGFDLGGEAGLDMEEVEIDSDCTELTEDSDMYNDFTESSDQEDLYIDTDSEDGRKSEQKRDSVTVEMQDLRGKDDDELVDIETFEEKDEKNTALLVLKKRERGQQNLRAEEESEKEFLHKKKKQEMERRSTLRECFHKMRMTLNLDGKSSKMTILTLAREEICALIKQRDQLVNMHKRLKKKRAYYLQLASQISGKTEESISQKLDEIITKQKSLENQDKSKDMNLTPPAPKSMDWDLITKQKKLESKDKVKDILHTHAELSPNSKPVDLSISKQKGLGHKPIGSFSSKKKVLDSLEKETILKPTQPAKPPSFNTLSTSQPTLHLEKPASLSRERTRPNILSRSKSQALPGSPAKEQAFVPQVIPLVEAVVPCNQIITISNPLQPIGITSLGERQSATPGVAAVSISVPAISHPIRVENPVPILQPQVLTLASSPLKINSPVKAVNLPKISSVVSLVPPEKLLITPPVVLQKTDVPPVVQTQAVCSPVHVDALQNPPTTSSNEVPSAGEEQGLDKQSLEDAFKQDDKVKGAADVTKRQKEEEKAAANNETEVENLMSLLDELVYLDQQLSNEPSQPQGGAESLTEAGSIETGLPTEKEPGVDRDDERSLSPLFLRLDEDLIASTSSKDEMDDIPPKVDDLVKVIFGSDSPPNSSESEVAAGANDDSASVPGSNVKNDAPSPPPLMQMKAGGGPAANSLKEQASVSWRPMPKLAPLGVKTQDAGQPKAASPHVLKPSSKPPSLRSAHT
ncbi:LOW QUALITY PROTEIN: MAX dimerization protein MGA a [Colossoma macropomum]|uniref:LOW QUALITY PROTEIN: MAX dimerization protein MGA a n=1 Tax=Colossoma macropomum TaxID=42526 RepID=UPI001864E1A5|nr:LOW QUALITY PROTEIN: MAX dimerization protein MGA a [Colossoma macropomum]